MCIVILSSSAQKSEPLNPVVLASPVIPLVSAETNRGMSAKPWHQEIKKRGRGGPFGERIGSDKASRIPLISPTLMLDNVRVGGD